MPPPSGVRFYAMALRVGESVVFTRNPEIRGVIDRISPAGIHYRVRFDSGHAPDWPQVLDGACYFYGHELEPRDG